MEEAVASMDCGGLGVTLVADNENRLLGLITDGDLRRLVARKRPLNTLVAEQVMSRDPRSLQPDSAAYDALNIMETFQITVLPIVDSQNLILGILHLHDILGKGEFKFNGFQQH